MRRKGRGKMVRVEVGEQKSICISVRGNKADVECRVSDGA